VLHQPFLNEAKQASEKLISSGPEKVKAYRALLGQLFPHPSYTSLAAQYNDPSLLAKNPDLESTISKTLDALDEMSNSLVVLEEYLTLNIPKMEDGNNFGV
jgi:hypothetical protein